MTENPGSNQFKTLHENCTSVSSEVRSSSPQSRPPTCPHSTATKRAILLLGCYPKGSAEDPQTYVGAVALVLAEYPEAVVMRVTDPRTGLPRQSKWLPSTSEITAVCEREMGLAQAETRRRERLARAEAMLASEGPSPERRKELVAEMLARFAGLGSQQSAPAKPLFDANDTTPRDVFADRGPVVLTHIGIGK